MDSAIRVEIHFHQQDEASVFSECNETDERQEQRTELMFFSLFIAEQLAINLGGDQATAKTLANLLTMFELPQAPVDHDFQAYIGFLLTTGTSAAKLVDYKGSPGRKVFEAELRWGEDSRFTLNKKGFGLLSTGIGYYAPNSVLLLWQYLGRRRIKDQGYLYNLVKIAEWCGKAYLSGKMSSKTYISDAARVYEIADSENQLWGPHWLIMGVDRITYLAFAGEPDALYSVGMMYHKGEGRSKNYKVAADHFRKASEKGHSAAKYMLGCMYLEGHGVEQSYRDAIKWITEAAQEGQSYAQMILGQLYHQGIGVTQNRKEAIKWYSMAAKQGNTEAQKRLREIG